MKCTAAALAPAVLAVAPSTAHAQETVDTIRAEFTGSAPVNAAGWFHVDEAAVVEAACR